MKVQGSCVKKMKIDKMADARIFIEGSLVCRDHVGSEVRGRMFFLPVPNGKHREIRHDVEDGGWGRSTVGSLSG